MTCFDNNNNNNNNNKDVTMLAVENRLPTDLDTRGYFGILPPVREKA